MARLCKRLLGKSIPSVLSGTTVTPVIIWGDSPGAQRWFRKPSMWLTCLCEFGTPSLLPTFSSDFKKQCYLYFNQHYRIIYRSMKNTEAFFMLIAISITSSALENLNPSPLSALVSAAVGVKGFSLAKCAEFYGTIFLWIKPHVCRLCL